MNIKRNSIAFKIIACLIGVTGVTGVMGADNVKFDEEKNGAMPTYYNPLPEGSSLPGDIAKLEEELAGTSLTKRPNHNPSIQVKQDSDLNDWEELKPCQVSFDRINQELNNNPNDSIGNPMEKSHMMDSTFLYSPDSDNTNDQSPIISPGTTGKLVIKNQPPTPNTPDTSSLTASCIEMFGPDLGDDSLGITPNFNNSHLNVFPRISLSSKPSTPLSSRPTTPVNAHDANRSDSPTTPTPNTPKSHLASQSTPFTIKLGEQGTPKHQENPNKPHIQTVLGTPENKQQTNPTVYHFNSLSTEGCDESVPSSQQFTFEKPNQNVKKAFTTWQTYTAKKKEQKELFKKDVADAHKKAHEEGYQGVVVEIPKGLDKKWAESVMEKEAAKYQVSSPSISSPSSLSNPGHNVCQQKIPSTIVIRNLDRAINSDRSNYCCKAFLNKAESTDNKFYYYFLEPDGSLYRYIKIPGESSVEVPNVTKVTVYQDKTFDGINGKYYFFEDPNSNELSFTEEASIRSSIKKKYNLNLDLTELFNPNGSITPSSSSNSNAGSSVQVSSSGQTAMDFVKKLHKASDGKLRITRKQLATILQTEDINFPTNPTNEHEELEFTPTTNNHEDFIVLSFEDIATNNYITKRTIKLNFYKSDNIGTYDGFGIKNSEIVGTSISPSLTNTSYSPWLMGTAITTLAAGATLYAYQKGELNSVMQRIANLYTKGCNSNVGQGISGMMSNIWNSRFMPSIPASAQDFCSRWFHFAGRQATTVVNNSLTPWVFGGVGTIGLLQANKDRLTSELATASNIDPKKTRTLITLAQGSIAVGITGAALHKTGIPSHIYTDICNKTFKDQPSQLLALGHK